MKKRRLSFWEVWNMSFGFLGIQFGFALQNANTSRIFETLGASIDDIPILWIAAPVTGLVVQPIIGYFSDKTWTRLGRRRPYFLIGAILSSLALIIMPNSPTLWVAAGMLWIMDASINISMEPFRAFVADNLPDDQRTMGFAMQSFFIGIGAVVGSIMPYIFTNVFGMNNIPIDGQIPATVKWSFYLGALVFLMTVLWTVFRSKEYTPEELELFEKNEKISELESQVPANTSSRKRWGFILFAIGLLSTMLLYSNHLEKELYVLSIGIALVGLLFLFSTIISKNDENHGFVMIMSDLLRMPEAMKQLAWVQFFSWFALFSMWIYATQAVTSHIYGSTDTSAQLYNDGADWVTVLFAVYNGVAALAALSLPKIARFTSRKTTHMLCLIIGGLGLISMYFIGDPNLLILSMIGVGIAWASILSMPYAILSGSIPAAKMGYFMGVFNFFIVIPQLIAATILGFMVNQLFDGQTILAMVLGGASFILAGLLTLRVKD